MKRPSAVGSLLRPEEGHLSLLFVCLVILSSVWALDAAAWVEHLGILVPVSLLAVFCGFLFAKIPLPWMLLHPLGLVSGAVTAAYAVADTLGRENARANLLELWDRFDQWLVLTLTGGISTDNVLFLLLLAAIIWLIGYFGTWSVFKAQGPWWVILTSGSVLVVNLSYARNLDWFALLYLLASMLLVVRLNIAVQEAGWRRSGVEFTSDFSWQLVRSGILIGVVAVTLTWMAPIVATGEHLAEVWTRVSGPWQGMEGEFSRLFGGLHAKEQNVGSGFGRTLPLRGASSLSDSVVLVVKDKEPRYLRGVVYDRYTGQGWLAPEMASQQMPPNDDRLAGNIALRLREDVTTTVTVAKPRGMTVLAPAQPERVSMPLVAELDVFQEPPDNGAEKVATDVGVLRSSLMLRAGQQYQAVASISRADAKSLQKAGIGYPEWVKQRYLDVPRSVPQRVRSMARRIAGQLDNPYDKAVAIENFLRDFPYSDTVPAPPGGRDAVDYFLFEARIGYCDYYASAMAIMLRGLGVPARVVSGYAPGDYDPSQQAYLVRDAHAHTWPEVYFPEYGWVNFEPTASRPVAYRPQEQVAELETEPSISPLDLEETIDPSFSTPDERDTEANPLAEASLDNNRWLDLARVWLPTALLLYLAYRALHHIYGRGLRRFSVAEAAYGRLLMISRWVGAGRRYNQTPFEHARQLGNLVPQAYMDIELIVGRFVRQRFGRKPAPAQDEGDLELAWKRARGKLISLIWRRK